MSRFPFWKYIVILCALIIGGLYSLPNLFGESPIVQIVQERRGGGVDSGLARRVETALSEAGLATQGLTMDGQGVKVRFADTDNQLRAKDVLQSGLGEGLVVALGLQSNSPAWLHSLGALPMYLGLDLRGGVQFLLQIDLAMVREQAIDRFLGGVRATLRDEKIPMAGLQREGDRGIIRFRDVENRDKAATLLGRTFPDWQFSRVEGETPVLAASMRDTAVSALSEMALDQNLLTLRNRVNELGVAEPIIQRQGSDRIVVQLPGIQDTAKAKEILGRTARLEIRMVDDEASLRAATSGARPGPGMELYADRDGSKLIVKKTPILTGENISNARPGFDGRTSEPSVHITLDSMGTRLFQQATRDNVGKRMAILLIEKGKGQVVTAPVIREEIAGGQVQISGRMNAEEATETAMLLRAGALAAPMEIIEERTVGPALGAENIRKGMDSVLYGFAVIALFMGVYYRVFGAIANIALAVNLVLLVSVLSMMQATLTLPGIAAIALTVGMAIDANVLINERIREELRAGRTPWMAIEAGYDRAFDTILDSNVTTFIVGAALFSFGTGPVRGFAVVLCLGILTSMFSAVLVSRGVTDLIYGRRRKLSAISI